MIRAEKSECLSLVLNPKHFKMALRLLVLTLLVTATYAACPSFWTEWENNCYLYVGTPSNNWNGAEAYCVKEGAHLTSIHSEEEDKMVKDLWRLSRDTTTFYLDDLVNQMAPVSVAPFVYIGLNDKDEEGTFVWTDGTPVDYTNWMRAEPRQDRQDLMQREDGVFIWDRKDVGKWNDVNEQSRILIGPFICKQPSI